MKTSLPTMGRRGCFYTSISSTQKKWTKESLKTNNAQKLIIRSGGKFRFFPPFRIPPIKTTFSSFYLLQIFCLGFTKKCFLLVGKICSVCFVVILKHKLLVFNWIFISKIGAPIIRSANFLPFHIVYWASGINAPHGNFFTDKTTVNLAVVFPYYP